MSKSLLGTYLRFLRSPNLNDPPVAVRAPQAAKSILRLYSVHLVAMLLVLSLIGLIPAVQDSNNLLDSAEGLPVWYLPFAAVVMAPLLEESIFRLPLRAFWINLFIAAALISLGALGAVSNPSMLAALLAGGVIIAIYAKDKGSRLNTLQNLYNRYSRFIFYAIAILFGTAHIANYDPEVWRFLPILVLPQVVIGLLLGFVRLRYGLNWAILLHALHNGCLLLPVFLIQIFGSEKLQGSMTESLDIKTLSTSDQLISGAVSLYTMGGIVLCGIVAWKVVREWKLQAVDTE